MNDTSCFNCKCYNVCMYRRDFETLHIKHNAPFSLDAIFIAIAEHCSSFNPMDEPKP